MDMRLHRDRFVSQHETAGSVVLPVEVPLEVCLLAFVVGHPTLVRACGDLMDDRKRTQQRLNALLLRHGRERPSRYVRDQNIPSADGISPPSN
jgi:hypothetical protein